MALAAVMTSFVFAPFFKGISYSPEARLSKAWTSFVDKSVKSKRMEPPSLVSVRIKDSLYFSFPLNVK